MLNPHEALLYLLLTFGGPILLNLRAKRPRYVTAYVGIQAAMFGIWCLNQPLA